MTIIGSLEAYRYQYQLLVIIISSSLSLFSVNVGYERNSFGGFLKDDYIPGDLGFDPFGLRPAGSDDYNNMSQKFIRRRTQELSNGRLAMLAVAVILSSY